MSSTILFNAFILPKYHSLLIKPNNTSPDNTIISHSSSLPFLSIKPHPPHLTSFMLSSSSSDSNPTSNQVAYDFSPAFKVYKDGHVERLAGTEIVPPGIDSTTGVQSKDVVISEDESISARIFLPRVKIPDEKLPVLVYFHGGNFCIGSAFSPMYHNLLNSITSQANVIGVSVNFRNAPEHPVPTGHEDSWTAVNWVASHVAGDGADQWINRHADLTKLFFAGESAGANIAHHMAIRVGLEKPWGLKLEALALVQPFFWGEEKTESELSQAVYTDTMDRLWKFLCKSGHGSDDPLVNPEKDPNLGRLDCKRVLICVAGEDLTKDRSLNYKELLEKNGFSGDVDVYETLGENHAFHLFKPTCENALALLARVASFIKQA